MRGKRAPLIAAAVALALVVLMVVFLVLPKMGQVSEASDELVATEAQQGTLESQLAALEQAQAAAPEAKATIQDVEEKIPPTADEAGMLLLVKGAAVSSGVTLTTITPGDPVLDPVTGLSVITLAVTAEGSYFALTQFLYSLETLPRAAKVAERHDGAGRSDDHDHDEHHAAADDRRADVHERPERRPRFGAGSDRGHRGGGCLTPCR